MHKLPVYFSAFLILSFFVVLPAFGFFYFLPDKPSGSQVLGTRILEVNGVKIEEKPDTVFELTLNLGPKEQRELTLPKFKGKKAVLLKGENVLVEINQTTLSIYNLSEEDQLAKVLVY